MNQIGCRPLDDVGALTVIIPVLDDWDCLRVLIERLHASLAPHATRVSVVAVDDGSAIDACRSSPSAGIAAGASVVLRLARNVGHQRAIAVGLAWVVRDGVTGRLAIMDADGEDRPEDLPMLLDRLADGNGRIVAASRRRRTEGKRFVVFYGIYKLLFRVLTGHALDFGNFTVLDREAAARLVSMHELWLNVPATMMRARLDLIRIPTDRGRRYAGQSRMNMVALVNHGLSAVGVFAERAFVRLLLAVASVASLLLIGLVAGLSLKAAGLATPGWVTTIGAALVIVVVQTAMVALSGLIIVFGNASNVGNSPLATAGGLVASVDYAADAELSR